MHMDLPNKDYIPVIDKLKLHELTPATNSLMRILHAGIGMSGETGEVLDSLKKSLMYGKDIDIKNLKEECGDILWYMALLLDEIDSDFEEVMDQNIKKLKLRYPEGFTEKDALERKDKIDE